MITTREKLWLWIFTGLMVLSGHVWTLQYDYRAIQYEAEIKQMNADYFYHRRILPLRNAWGNWDEKGNFVPMMVPHWCTQRWTDEDGQEVTGTKCNFDSGLTQMTNFSIQE